MPPNRIITLLCAALFLSLAANCFMAGLLFGRSHGPAGSGRQAESGWRGDWRQRDEMLRQKLLPADYKLVREAMQRSGPKFKELRQNLDEARRRVEEAQNAQPFDQAAFDAALRSEYETKKQLKDMMRVTLDSAAQQLSPDGRRMLEKFRPQRPGERGGMWKFRFREEFGGMRGPGQPLSMPEPKDAAAPPVSDGDEPLTNGPPPEEPPSP